MPTATRFEPNWQGQPPALTAPTNSQNRTTLYKWGTIEFQVILLNVHEVDHETETDWAKKEIAGAPIFREWVGENDEVLMMRGHVFPYRIGGMKELEHFEAMRRAGVPNLMVRGDGAVIGWFVCERLSRSHTFLSTEGVGQQTAFEAAFARVPPIEPATQFTNIFSVTGTP
jgi:phage protein U